MKTIRAQILSHYSPQRYAVRRTLQTAFNELQREQPGIGLDVQEISAIKDILKITPIQVQPCLTLNGRLFCNRRFPKKEDVLSWIKTAVDEP